MVMEEKTFLRYLAFTVPHVTVFSGAIFGILLLVGVKTPLSLGIFALLYGSMLTAIGLVVREHFSKLLPYRVYMFFSILMTILGLLLILRVIRGSL